MKIFSPPESNGPKEAVAAKKAVKGRKSAAVAPKAEVSDREIRDKLASHVETSNTSKSQTLQKNSKALGAGFLSSDKPPAMLKAEVKDGVSPDEESESSLKKSHLLLSDVKLNDPTDSNTQEKLKTVLRSGAFSFNPKEKETLEKILAAN